MNMIRMLRLCQLLMSQQFSLKQVCILVSQFNTRILVSIYTINSIQIWPKIKKKSLNYLIHSQHQTIRDASHFIGKKMVAVMAFDVAVTNAGYGLMGSHYYYLSFQQPNTISFSKFGKLHCYFNHLLHIASYRRKQMTKYHVICTHCFYLFNITSNLFDSASHRCSYLIRRRGSRF